MMYVTPASFGLCAISQTCDIDISFFLGLGLKQVFSDDEKRIQTGTLILGRVRRFHVRKDLLGPTGAIDTGKLLPVSRLGGISYGRTTEAFGASEPPTIVTREG